MPDSIENLKKVSDAFSVDTFFIPIIGAEIEFYLKGSIPDNILELIEPELTSQNIPYLDVKKEKGNGQFEVSIKHTDNPVKIANYLSYTKEIITKLALQSNLSADFSAKPHENDYGNAMHIHLSLKDKNGNNPMAKNDDDESDIMLYAIGGLLKNMPNSMPIFAPTENCKKRFIPGMDAPVTISWGGNNRTVALRLPTTTLEPYNRRIEHRVASSSADPYKVIAAILASVSEGILNKTLPLSDKIYGDASQDQYKLPKLLP